MRMVYFVIFHPTLSSSHSFATPLVDVAVHQPDTFHALDLLQFKPARESSWRDDMHVTEEIISIDPHRRHPIILLRGQQLGLFSCVIVSPKSQSHGAVVTNTVGFLSCPRNKV